MRRFWEFIRRNDSAQVEKTQDQNMKDAQQKGETISAHFKERLEHIDQVEKKIDEKREKSALAGRRQIEEYAMRRREHERQQKEQNRAREREGQGIDLGI